MVWILNIAILLLFVLVWTGFVAWLRLKRKKSIVYLAFFSVFFVYLFKVLDYTLFQFQSLILLKYFYPDLILRGKTAAESLNLVPLVALTSHDVKTSLLNILLMLPFGFGLPLISNLRMTKVVIMGALFSIGIEVLQLATGWLAETTFRIADVNDVIFNTLGAAIGYVLFLGFVRVYPHVARHIPISTNPISRYIAERPQLQDAHSLTSA